MSREVAFSCEFLKFYQYMNQGLIVWIKVGVRKPEGKAK